MSGKAKGWQIFVIFVMAMLLCAVIAWTFMALRGDGAANVVLAQPGQQAHQLLQAAERHEGWAFTLPPAIGPVTGISRAPGAIS